VVLALRDRADLVIDTSLLTAPDLKRLLTGRFTAGQAGARWTRWAPQA
jgi:RNase adaptor protein for sRNA GlmZ degradation